MEKDLINVVRPRGHGWAQLTNVSADWRGPAPMVSGSCGANACKYSVFAVPPIVNSSREFADASSYHNRPVPDACPATEHEIRADNSKVNWSPGTTVVEPGIVIVRNAAPVAVRRPSPAP